MTNSDWAAWMQAIGSIVAIGIAFAVPWWQTRAARQDQKAEHDRRRAGLLMMIHPELTDLKSWSRRSRERVNTVLQSDGLKIRIQRVDLIPEMPEMMDRFADQLVLLGDETATDIIESVALIRSLHRTGIEFLSNEPYLEGFRSDLRSMLERYQRTITKLNRDLEETLLVIARQHPFALATLTRRSAGDLVA